MTEHELIVLKLLPVLHHAMSTAVFSTSQIYVYHLQDR